MAIKELVYLGTPYTGTKEEMDFRNSIVGMIAKDLINDGSMVYSPINSWHELSSKYAMPTSFSFWQDMCESFLSKCSKLVVVMLPGWVDSVGLKGEVAFAHANNISIEYFDPTPYLIHLGVDLS